MRVLGLKLAGNGHGRVVRGSRPNKNFELWIVLFKETAQVFFEPGL
jgi:hypothetical protein